MKKEIGEYIKILSGYPFNSDLFNEENIGKPLIRIRDLERSYSKTYFNGEYEKTYVISQGDILVGMDGDFNAVKWKGIDSLLNQRICKIKTEENILDKEFMYQSLQSELNKIHRKTAATTVKHLSTKDIKKIKIFFPPLEEQKKIADILSTVDKKIAFVEENINATEELKKGLMQKLLTEGIGHTEFKDSELGRIPESWEVDTFNNLSIEIIDGDRGINYPKQNEFSDTGYCLFLSAKNVTKRGFEFIEKQFITEDKDSLLRKGKLQKKDIVLTTRGTVGNIAYFNDLISFENMRINSGMVLLRSSKLNTDYLYKVMNSYIIQNHISNVAFGSAQPQLTVKEIKTFKIPVPPLEEQKQIAEILSTVDNKLENLKEKKLFFEELKKGLMQKLLTGEVRV